MKKILIVDDQPEVRELVRVTLEVSPYELLFARSGDEALRQTYADHPDVILLDVMMPSGPNGLEVCQQLKEDPATEDIIIIMLTSKGQEWDVEAGYEAGADDYIIKPFSPLALLEKLEAVLDES